MMLEKYSFPCFVSSRSLRIGPFGSTGFLPDLGRHTEQSRNILQRYAEACKGDPNAVNRTYLTWFNTAAFAPQPANQWSNLGRFGLYGPGMWNFDVSIQREFKPIERLTMQFRLETFNTTNTQTPGNPNTQLGSSTFGQITSISGNRQVQLALKLLF